MSARRCPPPCGKIRHPTEVVAQLACARAAMRGKPDLIWYRAHTCHTWHLGSRKSSGRGGKRGQWVHQFTTEPPAA